jgi:hypothetical protein
MHIRTSRDLVKNSYKKQHDAVEKDEQPAEIK